LELRFVIGFYTEPCWLQDITYIAICSC